MEQPAEQPAADHAGVPVPPPLIYVAGLLVGWALGGVAPIGSIDDRVADPLAALLLIAWTALTLWSISLFWRRGTSIIPVRPTSALVTTGPYRFTRNPMYVGMALLYVAAALLFDLAWALPLLLVVLAVVNVFVIRREESYLERAFGDEYRAYRSRVRRWL